MIELKKTMSLLVLFLIIILNGKAQEVLSSSGATLTNSTTEVSFTLGELAILPHRVVAVLHTPDF